MYIQQKAYHEKIYENLARANARRSFQIEKEKALHDELLAHYEQQIMQSEKDSKRLRFRNFVAEKLQEERIQRGLDEEHFHQEYLQRILNLKREREKLGIHPMKIYPSEEFNQIQEHDHELLCNAQSRSNSKRKETDSSNPLSQYESPLPWQHQQNIKSSSNKVENKQYFSQHKENRAQINFDHRQKGEQQIFNNTKITQQLKNRWVPYDQREQYLQKLKEKQFQGREQHLKQIQKWHNQIKQRKIKAENSKENSFNKSQKDKIAQLQLELNKKYESAKKDGRNNSVTFNKKPILIQQNYVLDTNAKSVDDKVSNKKSTKKGSGKRRVNQSLNENDPYFIPSRQKQNKNLSQAMQKIKNRLTLSSVVYEDSEHRNILHEKTHLANKYSTECKLRKDIITKICTSKTVTEKYKNVGLACANQE